MLYFKDKENSFRCRKMACGEDLRLLEGLHIREKREEFIGICYAIGVATFASRRATMAHAQG